jgi:hypothetical protein
LRGEGRVDKPKSRRYRFTQQDIVSITRTNAPCPSGGLKVHRSAKNASERTDPNARVFPFRNMNFRDMSFFGEECA